MLVLSCSRRQLRPFSSSCSPLSAQGGLPPHCPQKPAISFTRAPKAPEGLPDLPDISHVGPESGFSPEWKVS